MLVSSRDETGGSPQAPQCHKGCSGSKPADNLNKTRFIYANVQPDLGCEAHQAGEGTDRRCERGTIHNEILYVIRKGDYTHDNPISSVSTNVERGVEMVDLVDMLSCAIG